jgi:aminoglycoside phosphotransferase (APT) family kinase protein
VNDPTESVRAWLERELGGRVVQLSRQPRWRPVWFADVERDGEVLELCVRGERVDMPAVFPLDHEMGFQAVLHDHGIPTARVHGWIDQPRAYVMDRVPGRNDFMEASAAERAAVVDDYLGILARLHQLDLAPFVAAGITRGATPEQSGTVGLDRYDALYRATKNGPEPFMEFCLGWLRRHPPASQGREAPIVWDSGQFHHDGQRVLAVLDVEIGHLGDPMMDLAAWRMRDTIIGYGDFGELYGRYEELRGAPVDLAAIQRHHLAFTLTNQLAFGAALRDPVPGSDYMTNLQWCAETNLFATEALAELLEIDLPAIEVPELPDGRVTPAARHLIAGLRAANTSDEFLRYELRSLFRLARHVARVGEVGAAFDRDDLDDLHELLGYRPASWTEGEAELEHFVLADAAYGRHDRALVSLFHRRNLRVHALLGPPGSAMTHHHRIQPFG